jgi:hypothetical protein
MLPFGRNDRPRPLFLKSDDGELIDVAIHPAVERSRAIAEFASLQQPQYRPIAQIGRNFFVCPIAHRQFLNRHTPILSGILAIRLVSISSLSIPGFNPQHHSNCPIKNRQPTRHGRRWKSGCIYHFPIRRLPARFRGFGMKIKQSLLEVPMRGKPTHTGKSHRLQPDVASGAIARSLLGPKPPKEICPIPTACP